MFNRMTAGARRRRQISQLREEESAYYPDESENYMGRRPVREMEWRERVWI